MKVLFSSRDPASLRKYIATGVGTSVFWCLCASVCFFYVWTTRPLIERGVVINAEVIEVSAQPAPNGSKIYNFSARLKFEHPNGSTITGTRQISREIFERCSDYVFDEGLGMRKTPLSIPPSRHISVVADPHDSNEWETTDRAAGRGDRLVWVYAAAFFSVLFLATVAWTIWKYVQFRHARTQFPTKYASLSSTAPTA